MNNPYQNEHLNAQVKKNMFGMRFFIVMELLGIFLCLLSVLNTYRDIYTHKEIRFSDLLGLADDTIYNIDITEMPLELYPSYYMVQMGDNALFVTGIDDELEKLEQTGRVTVRGQLRAFTGEKEVIKQVARDYFETNGYYRDNQKIFDRAAGHYLQCSDYSFIRIMCDDHPLGLVFGLVILIINSLCMCSEGTWYVYKHLHPACGSVKLSPQEIDEQANLPESQWFERPGLYCTPEILIGVKNGMTAVRYDDIEKICIRKKTHINWASSPKGTGMRTSRTYAASKSGDILIWAASDSSEYNSYQLIAVCKNQKKLKLCDATYIDQDVIDCIKEKCGPEVFDVQEETEDTSSQNNRMTISCDNNTYQCNTAGEFERALRKLLSKDSAEVWISENGERDEYPCIALLVGEDGAMLNYFGEDGSCYSSFNGTSEDKFESLCDGQYEIHTFQIISKKDALKALLDFYQDKSMSSAIKWDQLY